MSETNRRNFLKFIGTSGVVVSQFGLLSSAIISQGFLGCANSTEKSDSGSFKPRFKYKDKDDVILAEGLEYEVLFRWNDQIKTKSKGDFNYGAHNDHIQFIPLNDSTKDEGYLMVNHEYLNPLFVSGWSDKNNISKTKEQVLSEMKSVGASVLHIKKINNQWSLVQESDKNFRLDGLTEIPFSSKLEIEGSKFAIGTLANCAGGKTSWKTFLTCEENYDLFYGEWNVSPNKGQKKLRKIPMVTYHKKDMYWHNHFNHSPFHYGWVVEINPRDQSSKKLISLGRFAHEGATCVKASDGREIVYMGDDANNECIYKFISERPNSLEKGTLYVANTKQGKWVPIEMSSHPDFKKLFKNKTEMLINTRIAAHLLGGTPQDRPEDIKIHPHTNDIIVALTNNKSAGRPHGSLLKITEKNNDFRSLEFKAETWISGGEENLMSSPDNLLFDKNGNLWYTNDIAEDELGKGPYSNYKKNGLYYCPSKGDYAGQIFQIASAPNDAEFTGLNFSDDGKDLFICVQHPGERSIAKDQLTSTWPDKGELPKSSLIIIRGPTLQKLINS